MYERVERLARNNFKDAGMFLEKYVSRGRHIEVQIFGDGKGKVVAVGERDCSAQRRNQKVVEETPAPNLPEKTRQELWATAARLGESVGYANAGTVEFLYDTDTGEFYFLEVNTRLQVEHGVTEEVTGIDLVEWMVREAAGELPPISQADIKPKGASIQVRLYAEDPARDFRPSSGLLTNVTWPKDTRIETWVESGTEVSPFYDPMIAKIITTGTSREDALRQAQGVAGSDQGRGHRDQPRLPLRADRLRGFCRRQGHDAHAGYVRLSSRKLRGRARRHADDRAGLARTSRLVGRGRAAVGADGLALVPSRQPSGRQSRLCRGSRDHARGPDTQVQHRCSPVPHRRRDGGEGGRHAGSVLEAVRGQSRADAGHRDRERRRRARLSRRARRHRRAGLSRFQGDVPARQVRRPRRPVASGRRRVAYRRAAGARCACCRQARRARSCRTSRTRGRSACSMARTARRTSSPRASSRSSSRPTGRCTTIPTAPACGSSGPSPSGRARTAAKRGCIPPTSTTTPMPSAPWTSPATCRSSSDPTGRRSAASCARRPSSRPSCGRWASFVPATKCVSCASARTPPIRPNGCSKPTSRRSSRSRRTPYPQHLAPAPITASSARSPRSPASRSSSTAGRATSIFWSSMGRSSSTSSCASACTAS